MISLALSLALASSGICNPLQKCNLELEARVGIGLIFPPLHLKYAWFYWQFKQKRFNPIVSFLIRLVSVLVSVCQSQIYEVGSAWLRPATTSSLLLWPSNAATDFPPSRNPAGTALKPGRFQGGIFTQEHGQSHA
jgi:hypothetical protein